MAVMQAYIDGKDVQCQRKGFTKWSKVESIGYMRHQWDSRNENYRVVENGVISVQVGIEFDNPLSNDIDISVGKMAVVDSKKIIRNENPHMWSHYCVPEQGIIFTGAGQECNWCSQTQAVNLLVG